MKELGVNDTVKWDDRYIELTTGDVLREGDEYQLMGSVRWCPIPEDIIGDDPGVLGLGKFRRLKYRFLGAGEVIQEGDEFKGVDCGWIPALFSIGGALKILDVGSFRRPIDTGKDDLKVPDFPEPEPVKYMIEIREPVVNTIQVSASDDSELSTIAVILKALEKHDLYVKQRIFDYVSKRLENQK